MNNLVNKNNLKMRVNNLVNKNNLRMRVNNLKMRVRNLKLRVNNLKMRVNKNNLKMRVRNLVSLVLQAAVDLYLFLAVILVRPKYLSQVSSQNQIISSPATRF